MGEEVVEPRLVAPSHLAGTAKERGGGHGIWRPLRFIPSFFIQPRRVLGLSFKIRAAPFGPSINPPVSCKTSRIWCLTTSSREVELEGAGRAVLLLLLAPPFGAAWSPVPRDGLTRTSETSAGSRSALNARTEPWVTTTALSMMFWSSRTFPGHP